MHSSRETVNMRILQYFQTLCCVNKNGSNISSPPSSSALFSQVLIPLALVNAHSHYFIYTHHSIY